MQPREEINTSVATCMKNMILFACSDLNSLFLKSLSRRAHPVDVRNCLQYIILNELEIAGGHCWLGKWREALMNSIYNRTHFLANYSAD